MLSLLIPYLILCLTIELTPGPNMAYLAVLTTSSGRRAGFAAVLGIALGLAALGGLAAFGVAEIIHTSPLLLKLLRWAGFFYLLWLAWDTWNGEKETSPSRAGFVYHRLRYIRRGLITNLLNPKALLFYVALLPGFVGATAHPMAMTALLTAISVLIATAVHSMIVLLASQWEPFLTQPTRQRTVRRVMAVLLIGIAVWFVV